MTNDKVNFPCPFCPEEYHGNIGKHNLEEHIKNRHPEKFEEWATQQPKKIAEKKEIPPSIPPQDEIPTVVATPADDDRPKRVTLVPVEEEPPTKATRPLPTYREATDPGEWLSGFLEGYGLKKGFIGLQKDRIRIRNELPSASQLVEDIKLMDSGISNLRQAAYIGEIYEHELRQYLQNQQRLDAHMQRPYQGISLSGGGEYPPQFGSVPVRDERGMDSRGIPLDPRREYYPGYNQPPGYPTGGGYGYDRIARLEDELRRRDDEQRRRAEFEMYELKQMVQQQTQAPQKDPVVERLEAKLDLMEEDRRRKQEDEMNLLKLQIQRGTGLRPEDVERMIEAERGKITGADIQNMINQAMAQRGTLTETELKMHESKDKLELEKLKLGESAKTREAIAGAIKGGFGTMGAAIARTAQEVGMETQTPVTGRPEGEHMWQLNCPKCRGVITAPLSAKRVTCPSCNGQFDIMPPEQESIEQKPPLESNAVPIPEPYREPEPPLRQSDEIEEPKLPPEVENHDILPTEKPEDKIKKKGKDKK